MIIIADSGSSKTAWRIISNDGTISQEKTPGLNPYNISDEEMSEELRDSFLGKFRGENGELYFYGSGCASEDSRARMTRLFSEVLPDFSIYVFDDLIGAARATCGRDAGLVCILGTGANSCIYDGEQITENIPSTGFFLGDEGSGSYFGKVLLADFIRGNMPPHLQDGLVRRFGLNRDSILENVYRRPRANRYLAGFARFIFQHLKEPYYSRLVFEGFSLFIENYILKYEQSDRLNVHFTGSVAFYFSDILRKAAKKYDLRIGNILEDPIPGLTLYHQNGSMT